jgi:hypothetical protein
MGLSFQVGNRPGPLGSKLHSEPPKRPWMAVVHYSAKLIFSRLNMHVRYDYSTDDSKAIQKIIDGEADAYITSTGKVFPQARAIKNENRRSHLVPILYDRRPQDLYLPTTLSGEEYPNLLAPDERIETIATSVLLVSFNWPRTPNAGSVSKPPMYGSLSMWPGRRSPGIPQNCSTVSSTKIISATPAPKTEPRFFASFWSGRRRSLRHGEVRRSLPLDLVVNMTGDIWSGRYSRSIRPFGT